MPHVIFKDCKIEIHKSWQDFFTDEIKIALSLIESQIGNNFTPTPEAVYRFLGNNLNSCKYIILGQDPYPQAGVATGRAFEVGGIASWDDKTNTSLKNIIKLLNKNFHNANKVPSIEKVREEIRNRDFPILLPGKLFKSWEKQGVLLLNTSFTCELGSAGSHKEYWAAFSQSLIRFIATENKSAKWLLWGAHAKKACEEIPGNRKFESHHPRLNNLGKGSFFFENHFGKISDINWTT